MADPICTASRQAAEVNIQEATIYKSSLTMSAAASVSDYECNVQAMCVASLTCS